MTSAGPTPENEGIDPELQAAVESAFEEVPGDVREGLAQGSPEGAAGPAGAAPRGGGGGGSFWVWWGLRAVRTTLGQ